MVSESLIQAKVPDVANIPLVSSFEPGSSYVTKFLVRSDISWLLPTEWRLSWQSSFTCRNDGLSSFVLQATA